MSEPGQDTGQAREPDPACQGSCKHCGAAEDEWCKPGCPCDEGTVEPSPAPVQAPDVTALRSELESLLAANVPGRVWDERVRALLGTEEASRG